MAVEALLRFDPKAAALVLEEEVREAFFGSISSAIGEPSLLPPMLSMLLCRQTNALDNNGLRDAVLTKR